MLQTARLPARHLLPQRRTASTTNPTHLLSHTCLLTQQNYKLHIQWIENGWHLVIYLILGESEDDAGNTHQ